MNTEPIAEARHAAPSPKADLAATLERVVSLGGSVVHPGERFAICRDSEGSPFGLSRG